MAQPVAGRRPRANLFRHARRTSPRSDRDGGATGRSPIASSDHRRPVAMENGHQVDLKACTVNARTFRKLTGFSFLAPLQACAPIIAHGPDVHPGFTGSGTVVLGNGPTYENGDDPGPFYFGATVLSAGYGFRPRNSSLPAIRFGVQAPTRGGAAADIYLQAPRRWLSPFAAGVGVLAEFPERRAMPYLQAGARNQRGFGLNFVVGRYSDRIAKIGYTVWERAQVNWLNVEVPLTDWASLYLHGGFASGHVTKRNNSSSTPYVDEDRWVRLGGATIELHH